MSLWLLSWRCTLCPVCHSSSRGFHTLNKFTDHYLLLHLQQEKTALLRLVSLWMTPLTPKHTLLHKIHNTTQVVDAIFGVPPTLPVTWISSLTSLSFQDECGE